VTSFTFVLAIMFHYWLLWAITVYWYRRETLYGSYEDGIPAHVARCISFVIRTRV